MMFPKSASFWLSLCLTSFVVPLFFVATNPNKVSASDNISASQLHACAGSSRRNVGGPLARELQGKPVVIDIYATWCSGCKNIAPTLSQLKKQYQGKAHFIVFDVSDKATSRQAEARARELGLGDFFNQHKSQTASVTIVDPANGDILSQERKNSNLSDYTSVLDAAITQR
ncbi:MAG: thioredoxin domain-containing protein [Crocosphaera sp.]|nr:thioredoxin domain-containing protein [Crocosphaera sp.]